MLPNFKSKILTQLLDTQKDDGPLLLNLMGQCSQNVGLTEWTSDIVKQCPDDADCTKANFNESIRDYLEALAGSPNVGNQLIRWLCKARSHADAQVHAALRQLLSYLKGGYLHQTMEVTMVQEKSEQIFFA